MAPPAPRHWLRRRAVERRLDVVWRRWGDLSLRGKLVLFALALVTVPGAVFALVAFSGTRAALEREVGIQLQQTAQRGAEALSAALERARHDADAWARQDVMRELAIGDLDKRVSRFLAAARGDGSTYRAVLCVERGGKVIAASDGRWIDSHVGDWPVLRSADRDGAVAGPLELAGVDRPVLTVATPIRDPDAPARDIATLVLVYDWHALEGVLAAIRTRLVRLGKQVAAIVVDGDGRLIGGVAFDGGAARESALAAERWQDLGPGDFGARTVAAAGAAPLAVLAGAASVPGAPSGWSVLFLEPAADALAPVRAVRRRWISALAAILAVGLGVAAWLARQVVRPLEDVTRATASIAAHPERELPLLPVHSRNEVGQLTDSFNRMTRALKESQEEAMAAAKFAFAGELAAMIAHEVRTPLSVMRSSAQMLANPAPARSADNAELVETIVAEVDRIERVVTGLIQLARPLEQRPEATDLSEALARAAEFVSAHAAASGIRVRCEAGAAAPAHCDPEQIYQVVLNLVVNALQALPRGGTVRLYTLSEQSGMVGFAVADDGPGLPAAIRDRLFRPFVTGRAGGTGLGLAFVERIITAHHGRITVDSRPGHGTVFAVRLPVAVRTA